METGPKKRRGMRSYKICIAYKFCFSAFFFAGNQAERIMSKNLRTSQAPLQDVVENAIHIQISNKVDI